MPALAGTALLLAVTRHGAYVSPDGLAYIGTARNLVDGHGFASTPGSPPLGNFPPLYPLVLAAIGALGPDPLDAARWVGPAAFGLTILVLGFVVYRLTRSATLAVVAQVLVLVGVDFLEYHSAALSEPLFLLLSLLALVAISRCLGRRRPFLLAVAALLAGAASLTRYVGVAVVATGAVALLVASRGRRRAWMEAVAFGAIGVAPLVAWMAWVKSQAGRASNRSAVLHAPGWAYLRGGLRSATTWLLPATFSVPVRAVAATVLLLGAAFFLVRFRRAESDGTRRLAGLAALFGAVYLVALLGDRLFYDITGRLDRRFLLPVHAAAIVLGAWALRGVNLRRAHVTRLALCGIVGLQAVAGGVWLRDALTDTNQRPGGFASPLWDHSEVIDQVRALGPGVPVFTNAVDALWFHTHRVAVLLPEKRAFLTGKVNPRYDADLSLLDQLMRDRGGVLVYFTRSPARTVFLPTPQELETQLDLSVVARDGVAIALRAQPRT